MSLDLSAAPRPISADVKTWKIGTLSYTVGGLVLVFVWLLVGDFAWSMRDRSVGPMAQWYLSHLHVSGILFGLLVSSVPAIVHIVVCPLISVKSDSFRSRLGRRIPFLLVTTPLAALGMIGVGITPLLAPWLQRVLNVSNGTYVTIGCFAVFWTLTEVASMASKPIFDGLVNDVVPHSLLGRFYGLFRAVSLIDGMIFNYWIMGYVPTHFVVIMSSVGVFYGLAFVLVCLQVKEGEYPPAVVNVASHTPYRGIIAGVKSYCRECFSHSYYLSIIILFMTAGLCFAPFNTFAIPYAGSVGLSMVTYGKAVALMFCVSLAMAYFLGILADRFHPLRMVIFILTGYAGVLIWAALTVHDGTTFLVSWLLHGILSGAYYTTSASLGQRLFPGEKFAQFASAAALFSALAGMVMAPLVGLLIDTLGGNYRSLFFVAIGLTLAALISALHIYRLFKSYGGPEHYQAPHYDTTRENM